MTKDMEVDAAVIYCSDIPKGGEDIRLVEVECHQCGNKLVAAEETIEGALSSGHTRLMFRCLSHMVDDDDIDSIPSMPNWQREELNARGIDDETIDSIMRLISRHSQGDTEATKLLEQIGWMT